MSSISDHWICNVRSDCEMSKRLRGLRIGCVIFWIVDLIKAVNAWVRSAFGNVYISQWFLIKDTFKSLYSLCSLVAWLGVNNMFLSGEMALVGGWSCFPTRSSCTLHRLTWPEDFFVATLVLKSFRWSFRISNRKVCQKSARGVLSKRGKTVTRNIGFAMWGFYRM